MPIRSCVDLSLDFLRLRSYIDDDDVVVALAGVIILTVDVLTTVMWLLRICPDESSSASPPLRVVMATIVSDLMLVKLPDFFSLFCSFWVVFRLVSSNVDAVVVFKS